MKNKRGLRTKTVVYFIEEKYFRCYYLFRTKNKRLCFTCLGDDYNEIHDDVSTCLHDSFTRSYLEGFLCYHCALKRQQTYSRDYEIF